MSKEQSTFIVDLIDIAKRAGYKTMITTQSGHVVCEVNPGQSSPVVVNDEGEVHMKPAEVDYGASNESLGELMQFLDNKIETIQNDVLALSAKVAKSSFKDDVHTKVPQFDPRKHVGETFSKACKSWQEDIAEATGPRSGLAKTVEHLTVHLDPEELYDDLVKSPEFKSAILDALCRSPRTDHIKL